MVSLYMVLVLMGWVNIYAAVYNDEHNSILDMTQSYGMQLVWIGTAVALALAVLITDTKFFTAFAYLIYGITIIALLSVLIGGKEIAGSKSWFEIGSFAIQPAEFAKFSTNLAIARYLSGLNINVNSLKTKLLPLAIIGLPAILILLQNDTGSALVYSAFVLVLYRQGLSGNLLVIGVFTAILFLMALLFNKFIIIAVIFSIGLFLFFFIRKNRKNILVLLGIVVIASTFTFSVDYGFEHLMEPHQKARINVLLGKEIDLKGAGYNVNQSKIAIGSGGFIGKGFLKGTQTKYNFVPEQSTDFIFCTVGEEWGFLGVLVVISLFVGLFIRIIQMAERQRSDFSRIYGYGVAAILFFHFVVNIGMTIGLMPVIGIPLPFFSYGGSSLWAFTILLFIFIKQDANRLQLV
ncbi:MAG: rod shape-determining protein RodA [Geobacteraceae bacterium]|nr:rod shape-determining protein RodA [Geobacteraceae bacterium]